MLGRSVKPDWPLTCVLIVGPLRKRAPRHAALWADHEAGYGTPSSNASSTPTSACSNCTARCYSTSSNPQALLVFTATPGTESSGMLRLLSVIGGQRFTT